MLKFLLVNNAYRLPLVSHQIKSTFRLHNTLRPFQIIKQAKSWTHLRTRMITIGTGVFTMGLLIKRNALLTAKCDRVPEILEVKISNATRTAFDWQHFWHYLKPHLAKFIGAICAALAVAYFNIQIPNLLGVMINTLSQFTNSTSGTSDFIKSIKEPVGKLFTIYMLQAVFTSVYICLLSKIGEQMAAKIKQDLFDQIIIQDLAFFDANRTGELVNRLTVDVQEFKSSFKQCVSQGLRCIAQLIGGGISLFMISPVMAGIALVSVPTAVLLFSMLGRSLRALSKRAQIQNERATTVCEEALSNIRTVRANACEYQEMELFERETEKSAMYSEKLGTGIAIFQGLTNFMLNGMISTTLFVGGYLMSNNDITPGQLMAFLVASQGVQRSLTQGSLLLGSIIRGLDAGSRVFEFLTIKPSIDINHGLQIPKSTLCGSVVFRGVDFTYPSRADQRVLTDFNLDIRPGQTVALVGASGSGKSTVAGLLERFYEPTGGSITIDGFNLNTLSPNWIRGELIGFIEQQPILFATTIYENIRYGRPDATEEEIISAAKFAQAHDFIDKLPNGYRTDVGERGVQLSGGQRQRIAIARALLKKPTILILDEATSALDATSEAKVQTALDEAVKNRTTLVIAHRLSTIRNADMIVVMNEGRIVEVGNHNSLIARKGFYLNLIQQQEKRDQEENRQSG